MGRKSSAEKATERRYLTLRITPAAFEEISKLASAVCMKPTVYCDLAARGIIQVDRSVLEDPVKK